VRRSSAAEITSTLFGTAVPAPAGCCGHLARRTNHNQILLSREITMRISLYVASFVTVAVANVAAQSAAPSGPSRTANDTAFAAMQERGRKAMGVDQYTSTHVFDALPDGGRIELQRDADDSAGVAQIRAHLREVARAF